MDGVVAAELHRLIDDQDGAKENSDSGADMEDDLSNSQAGSLSDASSEGDLDEFDDMDDANEDADLAATIDLDTADANGNAMQLPNPPQTGEQAGLTASRTDHNHSNAKDTKATGVARAAARLLQQDALEGGLGILSKSKSVAKRQAEEAADSKADRAAKRLRLEMKHRGHVVVPRRGEDPQHDADEKALLKLATRGVVRLFNAISKAQRDQKDALVGGSRTKVAKLDKASFLAELRGVGGSKGGAPLPAGTGPATAHPTAPAAQEPAQASPAWDVLSDGFGLQGGVKMKDWDKEDDSDSDIPSEALNNLSHSDDE